MGEWGRLVEPTGSTFTDGAGSAPPELADLGEVTVLRRPDGGTVYLLGTCHCSQASAFQASELVKRVRPSAVVLELCQGRRSLLDDEPQTDEQDGAASSGGGDGGIGGSSSSDSGGRSLAAVAGDVGSVMSDWTHLIKLQYSALDGLEAPRAGGEFRAAALEAEVVGSRVILGDRSVDLTALRLKRLVPYYELISMMLFDDPSWVESQAIARHEAASELQGTSAQLAALLAQPAGELRDAQLHSLSASLGVQAERALDASIPSYADAVMNGLLRRFWCKELIGEDEQARLRTALDASHRIDPLSGVSMPPTMRRILLSERDLVLADALKRADGQTVVGVVGKAHVPGIARLLQEEVEQEGFASRVAEALEHPRAPLLPLVGATAACVGLPVAAYRSRVVRRVLGAGALALGGGAAWLVYALRDRINFYERSQRELREARGRRR
jgi:pheromone shutdown protein TraB